MREIRAGIAYFGIVYAAGFVLGTARELLVVPSLGRLAGVVVEAPLMLAAMTAAAVWCIGRFAVEPEAAARLTMGLAAFALLIAAEAALAPLVRGLDIAGWLASFATPEGLLSLALFVLLALMPLVLRRARI